VALAYFFLVPQVPSLALNGTLGAPWAAATLVVAGLYQGTPLKDTSLRGCRTPFDFLITGWRPGFQGALRRGARHAAYCVGCCALLFAVLFAVGLMAFGWMLLVALVIFVEKLLVGVPARVLSMSVGAVLIGLGVPFVVYPTFALWALGVG
jgi:predicted metal-binding membrane protein